MWAHGSIANTPCSRRETDSEITSLLLSFSKNLSVLMPVSISFSHFVQFIVNYSNVGHECTRAFSSSYSILLGSKLSHLSMCHIDASLLSKFDISYSNIHHCDSALADCTVSFVIHGVNSPCQVGRLNNIRRADRYARSHLDGTCLVPIIYWPAVCHQSRRIDVSSSLWAGMSLGLK